MLMASKRVSAVMVVRFAVGLTGRTEIKGRRIVAARRRQAAKQRQK
jgi:hypothetical protein